jgi:streptogramin lyase
MLEKEIEAYLVRQVEGLGGKAWKFVSPAHRGVADRVVLLPSGAVWFVEVKTEVGRLSPLQEVFRREVNTCNGNYVCLYGKKDVELWLASL